MVDKCERYAGNAGANKYCYRQKFIDHAASVRSIILSGIRLDIGHRFALIKDLQRTATQPFLVKFEYNFLMHLNECTTINRERS
jgi:hypothetical protein